MPCAERREKWEEWRDAQGNEEQRWEMAMRERSSDGRERERERERKKCAVRRKVKCLEVNSIFLCIEKYCSLPRE
jgi:hypothetical protein